MPASFESGTFLTLDVPRRFFFFFNDTATTEIYTLSLHDALPIPTTDCPLHWVDGHPLIFGQSPNRSWPRRPRVTTVKKGHTSIASSFCGLRQVPVLPHKSLLFGSQIPFARATEIGELSAFTLARDPSLFEWSDANYKTPELDDLAVYELQVAEFNDTFDGVIDRLDYLQSLGINCLELMPVTSVKLDFDWGYGPLHYFAPNARLGGGDGLKRLVNEIGRASCRERV